MAYNLIYNPRERNKEFALILLTKNICCVEIIANSSIIGSYRRSTSLLKVFDSI